MRSLGTRRTVDQIAKVAPIMQGDAYDGAKVERAIGAVAEAVNQITERVSYLADHDLIVGQNTINHGLGRKPEMVYVAAKSASASFGWAWDPEQPGNPRPEQIVHVTVAGVPARARLEVR